jgi:Glycogen recognition site of AMP-activated protein kinase
MAKGDEGRVIPIRTRVSCHYEGKGEVFVAGTFNGWNPKATPMRRDVKGDQSLDLDLIPGTYEYKFVIEGSWCCDPAHTDEAHGEDCVPNSFGTMNRALRVG